MISTRKSMKNMANISKEGPIIEADELDSDGLSFDSELSPGLKPKNKLDEA